jgi:hypothetical protein
MLHPAPICRAPIRRSRLRRPAPARAAARLAARCLLVAAFAATLPACLVVVHGDETEGYSPLVPVVPEREARAVGEFQRVLVEGALQVELRVGLPRSVRVEGDAGRLHEVQTEVRDGTLVLSHPLEFGSWRDGPRALVDCPGLASLVAAGSGWVAVGGLDQESFQLEVRGSNDVRLRGRVDQLAVAIEGAGTADVSELRAQRVHASGSGEARVRGAEKATGPR